MLSVFLPKSLALLELFNSYDFVLKSLWIECATQACFSTLLAQEIGELQMSVLNRHGSQTVPSVMSMNYKVTRGIVPISF